ncbi:MAG: DNA-directed RNA polymerase [Gemmatimonadaceae bacterium]
MESTTALPEQKSAEEAREESLLERQRELEDNSLALGAQRFRRRITDAETAGKGSSVGAARKLLQLNIEPLAARIQEIIDRRNRGMRSIAAVWAEKVGADVAAYMTVLVVLNGASRKGKRLHETEAARQISGLLQDELRYRKLQAEAPGLLNFRMKKFNTDSYVHRKRSLDATVKYAEIDDSDITMIGNEPVQVGVTLIHLLEDATNLVEEVKAEETVKGGKVRNKVYVTLTSETVEWITKRNDALEFLSPARLPMVVPPLPWSPEQKGGYRFAMRKKFPLVRKRGVGVSPEHQQKIASTARPEVFEALNLIQNTAWKINADVVELVEAIQRTGRMIAGLAAYEDDPLPSKPNDMDTNETARKAWRRKAHAIHETNAMRKVRAVEQTKVVSAARSMAKEQAIYFPHSLDWRGRIYPLADSLSPQGNDLSRALLTFANAKPVGSEGARWLAIHGANCLGVTPEGDKISRMPFSERVAWIDLRSDDICRVAADPFTHQWWSDADKPLQFFAFCVEWSRYVASGRSEQFVSGLPISQDGSCNGLQHYSALLRDEKSGAKVNLLPMDAPQDIYHDTAEKVKDFLSAGLAGRKWTTAEGSPHEWTDEQKWIARQWLDSDLVTRKLTKGPTMTFAYGSKKFGFGEQIMEELVGRDDWKAILARFTNSEGESKVGSAATLMADMIWRSLEDLAPGPFTAMQWMTDCARMIASEGKCVRWTVPLTNFPVRQEYFVSKVKRIDTVLAGKLLRRPRGYEQTGKIDTKKQAGSFAPNFIHSLDAAALMLTVVRAYREGMGDPLSDPNSRHRASFGTVHDSYATVAGDCALLSRLTRQSFHRLHTSRPVEVEPSTEAQRQAVVEYRSSAEWNLDDTREESTPLPIDSLYRQFQQQMDQPEECPEPPQLGNLDPGSVIASEYFFA